MALIDDLTADVAAQGTVIDSLETLLANLATMISNAGVDPVKLQAVKDALEANTARIAKDVVANTPPTP